VIKFFSDERLSGIEIIKRLNERYGEDSLSRSQIYSWIKKVKLGRKDFSNIPPPGREFDEALPTCIAETHTTDPHLLTRGIAKALNIAATTVRYYSTLSLGMKYYYMR
jgi:hypothetical protein